jgi:uncharacterized protein
MKIEGSHELDAPREHVYALLTETDVLRRCIPGCESLEVTGDHTYAATMKAGVGAIKGTFKGNVHLEGMRPPEHYRIVVAARGGPGFVKGSGDFNLDANGAKTTLRYSGEMQVGGIIAGVGQRMIEGAAKMMAAKFFNALEAEAKGENGLRN